VQLIGEGESELTALKVIVEEGYGLSFKHLGIVATDLGGADIPANAELLLSEMHLYVNFFLLVFDNEGRAKGVIEALQRRKKIEGVSEERLRAFDQQLADATKQIKDPRARIKALKEAREQAKRPEATPGEAPEFVLWHENFEADNFTREEMCEVANSFMPDPAGEARPIELAEFEQAIADHPNTGVASVLVKLAQSHVFRIDKPKFAEALARYALADQEHQNETRPLIALGEHLVRLTGADRQLAGKLRHTER
jgi:hypothetical protein